MKQRFIALVLASVFLLTFAAVAFASHLANHPLNHDTTGAKFEGTWEWYSRDEGHGGWHFWGTITDTGCGDNDNVYSKARAEGYGYRSFYGNEACDATVAGNTEWQNWEIYDPAQQFTDDADYYVCRDRNPPLSDNCSSDEVNHFSR